VILGRHDEESSNDKVTNLKNPAVVNIQVNQESGQISVQLIPYIFREFVKESLRESGVTWTFQNSNITMSNDLELEPSIEDQYARIFEGVATEEVSTTPAPVELFDEGEIVVEDDTKVEAKAKKK